MFKISEGYHRNSGEKPLFMEIMAKNFPGLKKDTNIQILQIQQYQGIPCRTNKKKCTTQTDCKVLPKTYPPSAPKILKVPGQDNILLTRE